MKRGLGYIVSIVGLVVIALGVKPLNKAIGLEFLGTISSTIILVIGIVILVVGIIMLKRAGSGKLKEVPIYQGKEVIGFRRMKR